jgi:hypothetical protein
MTRTSDETAVVRFPMRRSPAVWVMREGEAWIVVAGAHGWAHGSRQAADHDAAWLGRNLGLPIRAATS